MNIRNILILNAPPLFQSPSVILNSPVILNEMKDLKHYLPEVSLSSRTESETE